MPGLRMSHRGKLASIMKRFQTVGLKTVLLKLCVSMYAMLKSWKGNCCLWAHLGTVGLH